jgi:uncharacterized Tic20 family protein
MNRDNDILHRLGARSPDDNSGAATSVPIRLEPDPRDVAQQALRRAAEKERLGRDIVREYEEKYHGTAATRSKRLRSEAPAKEQRWHTIRQVDWRPRSVPLAGLSVDERLWAGIAHGSFLLTLLAAILMDGWAALAMVFVPLAIYFSYREKSDFVAFHALQAFAAQIVGTVGWAAFLVIGSIVFALAITIAGLASVVLVGIPFVILFSLLYVVFVMAMLAVPVGVFILALIGAVNTYNGRDLRYPMIARWIDRQVSGGVLTL